MISNENKTNIHLPLHQFEAFYGKMYKIYLGIVELAV